MAGGWTRDGAIQDQIDDTVADAELPARASIPSGGSEPCRKPNLAPSEEITIPSIPFN
jgi:hypothetical protein